MKKLHCGAALAVICLCTSHAAGLNDTGITNCSNDTTVVTTGVDADSGTHPRQDCRYGRDAAAAAGMPKVGGGGKGFDFTKIANDGTVLDATAVLGTGAKDWACTRDNVTGLIWEVKTTSGLRSQSHTYTWYNSDVTSNGGSVGTASGGTCASSGRCDTEKFVADVNSAGLCGATDWRMASKKDLISIVDYGRTNPAIDPSYFPNTPGSYDPSYFPNTPGSYFWSTSAYTRYSEYAWNVYFYDGYAYGYVKSGGGLVRLVRAGQ